MLKRRRSWWRRQPIFNLAILEEEEELKNQGGGGGGGGHHRLSDLPDSILTSILSRLKAREMMQTCILSKRWRNIWASACNIISSHAETWILYALKHNTKNLRIRLQLDEVIELRDCLFTSESLENLELFVEATEDANIKTDMIYLPRLRNLDFCSLALGGDFMEKLLFGCPASSQTLKHIFIRNCFVYDKQQVTVKLAICTPNVKYLRFHVMGDTKLEITFNGMCNVTTAHLTVYSSQFSNSHLLCSFSGLDYLHLSSNKFMEMLEEELKRCPTFHNLKNLSLGSCCVICAFVLMSPFLKRCPNLENLFLFHSEYSYKMEIIKTHSKQNYYFVTV
ncbi:hypothetical protein LUZ60_009131 [Juncus effusus]|nr:hypothetical protein LUZ60_009131 [Juncus effusus]